MTIQDSLKLIDDLLDGDISEADALRLEAEMHVDREVREAYYDRVMMADFISQAAGEVEVQPEKKERRFPLSAVAVAASLLFAVWAYWSPRDRVEADVVADQERRFEGFGIVTGQTSTTWADGQAIATNSVILPGQKNLSQGIVRIELFSGVTLVIEGEADFEILSPMEMRIDSGKLHASVPEPAQGFRVHTPTGDVVDLGTEFALDLAGDSAQLHVLDGEVEWHGEGREKTLLTEGQALSDLETGAAGTADSSRFTSAATMENLFRESQRSREIEAGAALKELANDPAILGFYAMDSDSAWCRHFVNAGGVASDASAVAVKASTDRWGNAKGALNFSQTGSRLRLNVEGGHSSLTLGCWVQIYSLDRWFNSLFLTDGHEVGEPHWQILQDGRLHFSVKKRDGEDDKHIFYSPKIWDTSMSGQWLHLVVTYDGSSETVRHFVNGQPVSEEQVPDGYLVDDVRIGAASIGNWSEPYQERPDFVLRNLNGNIDDFLLLGRAMSAVEVLETYNFSRP